MKIPYKKLFRRLEDIWEGDLPDIHKKHRRKTKKRNKGRIRMQLKKIFNYESKN